MTEALASIPDGVWQFGLAGTFMFMLFRALKTGSLQTKESVDQRLAEKQAQIDILRNETATLKEVITTKDGQLERLSVVHEFQQKTWTAIEQMAAVAEQERRR